MRDQIEDVLLVLEEIRKENNRNIRNASIAELRKLAVKVVAEKEYSEERFSDFVSAKNSIHDACVRRLKPEIKKVSDFDEHVENWLRRGSKRLEDLLIQKAVNEPHIQKIKSFFANVN